MSFGLGVLRHSSEAFWKMTPHEIAAAAAAFTGGQAIAPPSRAALASLMANYPDRSGANGVR